MTDNMNDIEPGLRSKYPITRVSRSDRRSVHSYYTMSPMSGDGKHLVYFEFNGMHADWNDRETLKGRPTVTDPDGLSPRPLDEIHGSACQGAMQQWVGDMHRIAMTDYAEARNWRIIDLDTGQRWGAEGHMRSTSPDGKHIFLQTSEDIHLRAAAAGQTLSADQVATHVIDYETDRIDVTITAADVLASHPEADEVSKQHMCFKQTLFSPDGKHLSFVFSNAWYCRYGPGGEQDRHELHVADRDGTNIRWLGPFSGHPSWHPAGDNYFAISRVCDGRIVHRRAPGTSRFVLYPIDGSDPVILGVDQDWQADGHPSFRPGDTGHMATEFHDGKQGRATLRLYDIKRLEYEDILVAHNDDYSSHTGTHLHPAWSPDGRSLYISSSHTGVAQVYRIDIES